ncbi:TrkH family potassium uptake protein [Criibacterium bergeronii]|uniref:TrkH family potassium uptake protein n=1 Tax=Criibacterium bergeronii TaxID=1871336 RepID=A0A371ILG4_9FIRM|nr:TrkH family potassium uptake protein [Criibacterium bergeronii]RDY21323.1 TrkH family potassium uptake protein [Criibacterium bergeronii]
MNKKIVIYSLGNILKVEALLMIPSVIVALIYNEGKNNLYSFISVIALLLVLGFSVELVKPQKMSMKAVDGFIIVALSWVLLSFFGGLPFVLSGEIPSVVDAFFETASGFTTTGSSILTNVEALSHSMLFWRSFTHLIGGMGILVFTLAVLPSTGLESVHVMQAEIPGPVFGKLVSKMRSTAKILYGIYLVMTAVLVVLLMLGGMNLFDSLIHAFGTAGTGGFGIKAESVAYYDSNYIHLLIATAMILFGINFNLYYLILVGEMGKALKSEELRLYLGIIVGAVVLIFINIGLKDGFSLILLRDIYFQVSSIITTTGFSTVDFNAWPLFSKVILMLLMFCGACAGSTAGGLKVSRVGILFKLAKSELRRITQPGRVVTTKFEGAGLKDEVSVSVLLYFAAYIFIFFAIFLVVSIDTEDFSTAFTAVAATFNNIGPGLNGVGPMESFAGFNDFTKIVLSFSMIAGRLEIYPILVLFGSVFKK